MPPVEAAVWTLTLRDAPDLTHLLSDDERARASRFVHEAPRNQFIAARGGLRLVLAHHLGIAPKALAFTATGNGKPALAGHALHFNVSHSHEAALIAVSSVEVGVDVECVRERVTWPDMARRYFTPGEVESIDCLEAFYVVWTRKEAFLKALGLGLSHGLERFAVSVQADNARILHVDGDAAQGGRWSLVHLVPLPGYVGAMAVEGPVKVTERRWMW